jgi:hypothetical protein
MLSFHEGAGSPGAVSRARMISLSACLGRQLPDEFLGIDSTNLLEKKRGPNFKQAANFLWPFKLSNPTGGFRTRKVCLGPLERIYME